MRNLREHRARDTIRPVGTFLVRPAGFRAHLTEELIGQLCDAIGKPNHTRTALALCDVSHGAFYNWMRRGMLVPDSIYGMLHSNIRRAEAERASSLVDIIHRATKEDPANARWLLSRLEPSQFGPFITPEIPIEDEGVGDTDAALEKMSNEQLRELERAAEILERGGEAEKFVDVQASSGTQRSDRVHRVDLPALPDRLAPSPSRKKT